MLKLRSKWGLLVGVVVMLVLGGVDFSSYVYGLALSCPAISGGGSSSGGSTSTVVVADHGSVPESLKAALLAAGYNETATAGIMGNISVESEYVPNKIQGGKLVNEDTFVAFSGGKRADELKNSKGYALGFGLAQWTKNSRLEGLQNHAEAMGAKVASADAQISFIVYELTKGSGYSALRPAKLNAMTIEEVTYAIYRRYETPLSSYCVGSECGSGKANASEPPLTYKSFIASTSSYELAYSAFSNRLAAAKAALSVKVSSDDGSSGDSGGSSSGSTGSGWPVTPGGSGSSSEPTSSGGITKPTTGSSTSGALGKQNVSGMVGQYDSSIKSIVWRSDGSTISASGCSLVSVVNAAKALGRSSSVSSLASWSKSRISSASWDNLKTMAKHEGLSVSSWLWSSKSTSDDAKIQKIRDTLASGGVVIAGGDRSGTDSSFCTSSRKSNGECVFTPGGHFVAIIGITSANKLVIANPGKSNDRTWIFPASGVLKYSNKAIMVK